jgi:AcrR family transcriptional regulator
MTVSDRRQRKKEHTRRALLDAGMALITQQGLHATRVEDITERADVGKGAFYNYFESKDALIAALVAEGVDKLEHDYLRQRAASGSRTDQILRLGELHQRFFDEHPPYLVLFHQARGLLQFRREASGRLRDVFRDYLTRLAAYVLPVDESQTVALSTRLGIAALMAGTLAGARSFQVAAGLPTDGVMPIDLLAIGLPPLLEKIPRDADPSGNAA